MVDKYFNLKEKISKKSKKYVKNRIFIIFFIIFAIILFIFVFFQNKIYFVNGNSQKPFIESGDAVFVVEKEKYNLGDILTFENNGVMITHRLIFIHETKGVKYYFCHGDNNDNIDSLKSQKENWKNYHKYILNLFEQGKSFEEVTYLCEEVEIVKDCDVRGVVAVVLSNGEIVINMVRIVTACVFLIFGFVMLSKHWSEKEVK